MFEDVATAAVAEFWDRRPCNIRHSPRPVGSREYFDQVEERKYFVEPHIPRFADFPAWQGKRVLEIGCGIGTDTISFARHGAQVTAVDLSGQSLAIARQRASVCGLRDSIQFCQGDAEELSSFVAVEPYDLVYSFGVIHHTPRPARVLMQVRQYVHSQSILKVMVYHRYSWKVLSILAASGWRNGVSAAIARHSEAAEGCPVTHTFSVGQARRLLQHAGFRVQQAWVDHIFPFRIAEYQQYRYLKEPWFRWMPGWLFRSLERRLGWHICLTAQVNGR